MKVPHRFSSRLRGAIAAAQVEPRKLAEAANISPHTIDEWLEMDIPPQMPVQHLIGVSDLLKISGRYLIGLESNPASRYSLIPDEAWVIEAFRQLSTAEQDRITDTLKRLIYRRTQRQR